MSGPSADDASAPLELAKQIDAICDRFEEEWIAGQRPHIEDYLDARQGLERSALFSALLRVEVEYRLRSGRKPTPHEYRTRFPEHAEFVTKAFQEVAEARASLGRESSVRDRQDVTETHDYEPESPAFGSTTRASPSEAVDGPLGKIGRFELRAVLGQGGFGTVYRAYDHVLEREVALKIPKFVSGEPRDVERFLREAKSAANLSHPNIVPVFESGRAGDDYFIASEFVAGQTLSERLAAGPVDFRQAARWVADLAAAFHYAPTSSPTKSTTTRRYSAHY